MNLNGDYTDVTAENFRKSGSFDEDSLVYTTTCDFILHLLRKAKHNKEVKFQRRLSSIRGGLANHLQAMRGSPSKDTYKHLTSLTTESFANLIEQIIDKELSTPRGFTAEITFQYCNGTYGQMQTRFLVVIW